MLFGSEPSLLLSVAGGFEPPSGFHRCFLCARHSAIEICYNVRFLASPIPTLFIFKLKPTNASILIISAGNTATPAYPVANRTLSDIRICTVLAPRMGIEPIQHFHMPLLALSMPPTYVIGIEPISHYVIRTLLIAIFRIDAVWICTTHILL